MKASTTFLLFISLLTSLIFISCNNDEVQAENSLEGLWEINRINSRYGTFTANSFNPTETVSDSGQLGTFLFGEETVDYSFMRNDSLFTGDGSWTLDLEKVNAGFFKVNQFTLSIEDQFLFDVTFEDDTKNAEKKATNITLVETPTNGFGVSIELFLEKK